LSNTCAAEKVRVDKVFGPFAAPGLNLGLPLVVWGIGADLRACLKDVDLSDSAVFLHLDGALDVCVDFYMFSCQVFSNEYPAPRCGFVRCLGCPTDLLVGIFAWTRIDGFLVCTRVGGPCDADLTGK
jgi:hypothetical protein